MPLQSNIHLITKSSTKNTYQEIYIYIYIFKVESNYFKKNIYLLSVKEKLRDKLFWQEIKQ